MTAQNVICEAIRTRRRLHFMYEQRPRVVEPHAYGVSAAGNRVLRGYQVGGQSASGRLPMWRMFSAATMRGFRVGEETFDGPRSDYDRRDDGMREVLCAL